MKKTVCNVCENDFDMWDVQESYGLHYSFGYGSKHDGDHIALDMCCKCFDNLLDYLVPKCRINPLISDDRGHYMLTQKRYK